MRLSLALEAWHLAAGYVQSPNHAGQPYEQRLVGISHGGTGLIPEDDTLLHVYRTYAVFRIGKEFQNI